MQRSGIVGPDRAGGAAPGTRAPLPLLEAGLVIAWSSGIIGALLAADAPSVFLVLFWRFVIVAAALSPFILQAVHAGLGRRELATQMALGALAMFGYLALGVKSIDLGVSAGAAALISALQPLVTAALAGPVLGEFLRRKQWWGLSLGFAGVLLAVGGAPGDAPRWAYGLSLAGMSALVAATLLAKARGETVPVLPALGIQSFTAAVLFAPLAVWEGGLTPAADLSFVAAAAWFILFSTIGGYGLYWLCLRRSTATRVGSLIYLTPPVTMLWPWLMFAEPLSTAALVGFALCLLGVGLARNATTLPRSEDPH